jgi:predicted PurR-regulated permease PerM
MSADTHPSSPRWGVTIKIIVGLSIALALGSIFIAFRSIVGPLLLSVILAYFLHPWVVRLNSFSRLNWRLSTTLVYLILIIVLIGFFTAAGVVIGGQFDSIYNLVKSFVNDQLPTLFENLSRLSFSFGPFQIDFSQFNLADIGQQLLNNLQALIGRAGGLIGAVASGAAGVLGWTLFVLLVSYFLVADAGRFPDTFGTTTIPGYDYDIRRMGRELGRIWNAYLRGQFLIIVLVIIVASILLTALGVRLALAIAVLTGLARFVPYIGPLSVSLITFVVALFQNSNYFNMPQIYFALMVVVITVLVDQIFDNYIVPRVLGQTLGVHPAAVLISAILLAQLIGLVGLVLAAPVLASLRLLLRYLLRKLFDLDPWPEPEVDRAPIKSVSNMVNDFLVDRFIWLKENLSRRQTKTSDPKNNEGEPPS